MGHGGCAVVFSLLFVAAGVFIILLAAGVIPVSPSSIRAPKLVIGFTGGSFALSGLIILVHVIRRMQAVSRAKELLQLHPDQPWLADYAWDTTQARDETLRHASSAFLWTGFLFVFLSPFNWWAFLSGQGSPVVLVVVIIFDLLLLIVFGHGIYLLMRGLKYGRSALRFERFPFLLGQTLDATFHCERDIGFFQSLTFTLRLVEEVQETHGSGKNRRTQTVYYQLYADTRAITDPGEHRQMSPELKVSFPLPADPNLVTRLSAQPPQYWELEVQAVTPGVDFGATFLVPVYAGPARQG